MSARHPIVVDCESTGLRGEDIAVEVAWWNLDTDERGHFIPPHSTAWVLAHGEAIALEMNGYRERILGAPQDDGKEVRRLFDALTGNTLVGSNPAADAAWLEKMFAGHDEPLGVPRPWHYRMWDIGAYAAGVLGLDWVPGLWDICQRLGIEPNDHTAAGDVTATGTCFRLLMARAAGRAA